MGSRILVFNANPFSMLSLVLWIAVFAVFVTAMERSAGDNIRIARPVDGEFVEQRFPIKGEAPGAPEGTYIFIVVRSMESQGALYEVSDVWTTGQHGWWQGVVHVPADVPVHGKVLVYAISASTPDYAVGQKYERPPRSSRKGGHTDAVTVKYLGN
ncbi:MAG: hypothetical protein KAX38_02860 [Candidatus Krumholzibacteria bacterium]|nr:hypothetical protein [Candidatus Krumholzibacteria bacterium]